ncbi:MAG TPA: hypothetical protein VFA89_20790 [Terriglobales bacterium]|nr:hypothetical protein [Terriglobales bacterium]
MLDESVLNTSNVNSTSFGKLYTRYVDGDIYAQPLYVTDVDIPGKGKRNVLYVVTVKNNVYAFDADNYDPNPAAGVLWGPYHLGEPEQGRRNTNGDWPSYQTCASASYYGITSTPVIDVANGWLYLVAKTIDPQKQFHQMLHRLDIRTGSGANPTPNNVPREIVYPDPTNPQIVADYGSFNPGQLNRAGLLLSQGVLYIAFAGHCDFTVGGDTHGWVMGYDARTLTQVGAFNTTPHDKRGGIWQSGNGLAADRHGNVYFATGNMGNLGENRPMPHSLTDFSQSIVRMGPSLAGPPVVFPPRTEPAPWYLDYHRLDSQDLDLTSSGPLLMPEVENGDLVGGGKTGRLYLLDRASMALKQTFRSTVNNSAVAADSPETPENCTYGPDHYGNGTQDPNSHGETLCPHIHSGLVYWHGPEGNIARVYVSGERDYLRAYRYDVTRAAFVNATGKPFGSADDLTGPDLATRDNILMPLRDPNDGSRIMPGATLSLSADGNRAGSGILWATMVLRDNAEYKNVYGILRAFDALTLRELWNSGADQFGAEFLGKHAKYAPPTIAGGKVFVPTFSNRLVVYGPLSRRRGFVAPWQEWADIGAPNLNPPIIPAQAPITPVARDANHMDLYLADVNGAVLNGGSWTAGDQWHDGYSVTSTSFVSPGAPVAALSREPSTVDLYVVRNDGSVWNAAWWSSQSNDGQWNAGYPIPGAGAGFAISGAPITAVARTSDVVDLYVVRSDGSVWNAGWWSGQPSNQWHSGYQIPGAGPNFARPGTRVAVVNRTPNMTDLYVVRTDGSIWNAGWWSSQSNNGQWNQGYRVGLSMHVDPGAEISVLTRNADHVDLFVSGKNGQIFSPWWDATVR